MATSGEDVYCTLVMNDAYLPGAAVLAHSLRDGGTKKKIVALITTETLSAEAVTELQALFDIVIPVPRTVNPNPANLFLMNRGDLLYTFTKIALWRQTQFRKIVYIDSDVVALRAPDELFDIEAPFAAAPDIGWPDAFNSGVMVISPNMGEYWALQTLASVGDSFDGADQGLLNQYYEHKGWHRLSFTYNCTPNAEYQWEPAYRHHKGNIKMVHFIGKDKPWKKGRFAKGGSGVYSELLGRWWSVYDRHLRAPPPQYQPGKSYVPSSAVIQKHVFGESTNVYHGYAPEERIAPSPAYDIAPAMAPHSAPDLLAPSQFQIPTVTDVKPFAEPIPEVEAVDDGEVYSTPATEQPHFSPPQMEWDATQSAPPAQSRPEAANFPTSQYDFSDDPNPYQPPKSYPEPPKDMWYEVPSDRPKPEARPKPIFPWEQRDERKPTRVFAEDFPPPPLPIISEPEITTHPPIAPIEEPAPFSPQANAWDNVASIERYVRAVMEVQTGRAKPPKLAEQILSPSGRRESLILTDFPTIDDRPSLPVTPAPIRRPTFWGEERDGEGDLPGAEGVPDQAEWVCPSCEFLATTPVAFHRARQPSSLVPAEPPTAVELDRSPLHDHGLLPQHLRPHRQSSSDASALSTTSTLITPSGTATAGPKDASATGHTIPAALTELREEEKVVEVAEADEEAMAEAEPPPLASPQKPLLPPPWLTASIIN
ncbi:glycosyltransferase family 8 protein [Venturia nashicola]|uniref:glycogenin glucosyltransferase n=1 Tax=Venturia nashicola TaxID=86259 RepID=A0A4Z1PLT8_9PEZI|nr:glycosyltransferase family 8 protein [Venturia nashicola]